MQSTHTSKVLIGLTLAFVAALLVGGVYFPNSFAMAFAGTSSAFMVVRIAIAILLSALLFTKPPRSVYFRAMLGVWAVSLSILASQLLMNYQLNLLDAVMFIEVAIIFGVEALESSLATSTKKAKHNVKRIPVRKIPARQRINVMTAS